MISFLSDTAQPRSNIGIVKYSECRGAEDLKQDPEATEAPRAFSGRSNGNFRFDWRRSGSGLELTGTVFYGHCNCSCIRMPELFVAATWSNTWWSSVHQATRTCTWNLQYIIQCLLVLQLLHAVMERLAAIHTATVCVIVIFCLVSLYSCRFHNNSVHDSDATIYLLRLNTCIDVHGVYCSFEGVMCTQFHKFKVRNYSSNSLPMIMTLNCLKTRRCLRWNWKTKKKTRREAFT